MRGGESYFVDSFAVAERLRSRSPAAFETLVKEPVAFEYRNGGHWRHWERPTIELGADGAVQTGAPAASVRSDVAVNYSPPFQAPLLQRGEALAKLRDALELFADATEDPALRYTVRRPFARLADPSLGPVAARRLRCV